MNISDCSIIFCDYVGKYAKMINVILLIFKQYIYATKCMNIQLTFMGSLARVVEYQKVEFRIANRNKKVMKHNDKWQPFIHFYYKNV